MSAQPHEFVITALFQFPNGTSAPLYWTGDRKAPWSDDFDKAQGIGQASKAYKQSAKVPAVEGARIVVQGAMRPTGWGI